MKKSGHFKAETVRNYLDREKSRSIRINPDSVQCFQESIDYLTAQGIKVVLAFIPVVDLLNELDLINQEKVTAIFRQTASKNKNVYYMDYNQEYQHNHALFYDLRHLNKEGDELVTARLVNDLRSITSFDNAGVD